MPVSYTCQQCGEPFKAKPSEGPRKFCGHDCYRAYEAEHGRPSAVQSVEFVCKNCGKAFHRQPGELRQYRKTFGRDPLYCSIPCSAVGRKADREERWDSTCVTCGKELPARRRPDGKLYRAVRYCGAECKGKAKSAMFHTRHPVREINRSVTAQGYVRIRIPIPGKTRREVLEHRYVMEQALGRPLRPEETVHHLNGRRDDNRLDNLDLRTGNHGPGGDVSAIIKWAHEIIALYPQFDAEGRLHPVDDGGGDHAKPADLT